MFNIPLAEVVTDYFDQLKSRSKGYASMEYKIIGYRLVECREGSRKQHGRQQTGKAFAVHHQCLGGVQGEVSRSQGGPASARVPTLWYQVESRLLLQLHEPNWMTHHDVTRVTVPTTGNHLVILTLAAR